MLDELKKPAQLRRLHKKNHNKKEKTLRQNVLHPLLITISVISAIMLLFFNVVIILMLYSGMYSDMRSISGVIEQIALVEGDTADEPQPLLNLFKKEYERRNSNYRANMLVLNAEGKTIHKAFDFYENEQSALEAEIASLSTEDIEKEEISKVKTGDDLLFFTFVHVSSNTDTKICLYTSFHSLLNTVVSGNKAFLIIIAFSILGFIIAANIIAKNISKPIKALSDHMDVIGDGDFTPVNIPESSAELNKLTASINEMLARLEAYNKAHNISIQNLSHDLRTPLMSIGGYAEAIQYGVMDSNEAAEVILKESKRLTNVVEKILILSQLDTLNQPVNMAAIYLTDFLEEEATRLEGYAMKKHIQFTFDFERKNVKVLADVNLLSTIVRNLLSNAIRYAKKEVKITVHDVENETILRIYDDGNGLSEEDLKYLFTRYYVGETGHSGLGLSTSKSAADYMGCKISGQNRNTLKEDDTESNASGAVFTVSFPKYE